MDKAKISLLKKSLANLIQQQVYLQNEIECGTIDITTAKEKVELLKKEEREKKKLLIAEVHIGKRGNPLSMGKYNEAKGLYITTCANGKQISSTSEDGLLDALMLYYGLSLNSPLIKDVYARAIERYERRHPDKSKTVYNYNLDFNAFIDNTLAKTDIRKLNKDKLEEYMLNHIREKKLKSKALVNFKTLLNLIFQQAIDEGFITSNVAKEINNNYLRQYCDQSLSHRKTEDVLYTDKELELIYNEAWDKTTRYYSPYSYALLLHAELGCRPDELICLKWSDFDRINGYVSIERQMVEDKIPKQSFRVVDYTKNEKGVSQGGRLVPLSTKALDILDKLEMKKKELGIESDWLFSNKNGILLKKSGYFDFVGALYKKLGLTSKGSYDVV